MTEINFNVEITPLKKLEADVLLVRLGTDEIPATMANIDQFSKFFAEYLKMNDIKIPFIAVSSLVRFESIRFVNGRIVIGDKDAELHNV